MGGVSTDFVNRGGRGCVALETTLLLHGVPRSAAAGLAREVAGVVAGAGARPVLIGLVHGVPTVGLTDSELDELLSASDVPKANTANLGVLMHRRSHAATTVSTTMELAHRAGVRVFATGGLGGVHRGYAHHLDVSSDLAALARFPVAVVASGVKSILDVVATRESLETLGIPVIGYRTDRFPAFYRRDGGCGVDARFDDPDELARFVDRELARTARGVLVCHPIDPAEEIAERDWETWIKEAGRRVSESGTAGRGVTPAVLGALHEISGGATLRANIALVKSNAELAGRIVAGMLRA